jgi:hypothetical protein
VASLRASRQCDPDALTAPRLDAPDDWYLAWPSHGIQLTRSTVRLGPGRSMVCQTQGHGTGRTVASRQNSPLR